MIKQFKFLIGFQMLKTYFFQMPLNTDEMCSNDIEIAFFFQKLQKNHPAAAPLA